MNVTLFPPIYLTQNEKTPAFFHARLLPHPPTSPLPFHTLICYAVVSTGVMSSPPFCPTSQTKVYGADKISLTLPHHMLAGAICHIHITRLL
jgi:hypothetical protein